MNNSVGWRPPRPPGPHQTIQYREPKRRCSDFNSATCGIIEECEFIGDTVSGEGYCTSKLYQEQSDVTCSELWDSGECNRQSNCMWDNYNYECDDVVCKTQRQIDGTVRSNCSDDPSYTSIGGYTCSDISGNPDLCIFDEAKRNNKDFYDINGRRIDDACPSSCLVKGCDNSDCQGTWSACTSACEAAGERTFNETQSQMGTGAPCPETATDCQPGEGECPSIVCSNFSDDWYECENNDCVFNTDYEYSHDESTCLQTCDDKIKEFDDAWYSYGRGRDASEVPEYVANKCQRAHSSGPMIYNCPGYRGTNCPWRAYSAQDSIDPRRGCQMWGDDECGDHLLFNNYGRPTGMIRADGMDDVSTYGRPPSQFNYHKKACYQRVGVCEAP